MHLSKRASLSLRIAAIALVVLLLALFIRRIDWDALGHALANAKAWPLVLSSVLYFVCLFGKAVSWRILLAPDHVVKVKRLFRYTIGAFAASALAPARAGEVLRAWTLKHRDGVPAHDTVAVAVAEKLLAMVSLLVLVAPVPWLLTLPSWVESSMLIAAGVAVGLLVALYIGVGHLAGRELHSWFSRFIAGMHAIRDPRRTLSALGVLFVVWLADLSSVMLVLHAVGIDVPLAGAMFILFTFNVAVALPSTPAQVGALQLGALVATRLLGVPDEPALAFGLLFQAMQIVPLLAIELTLVVASRAHFRRVNSTG